MNHNQFEVFKQLRMFLCMNLPFETGSERLGVFRSELEPARIGVVIFITASAGKPAFLDSC